MKTVQVLVDDATLKFRLDPQFLGFHSMPSTHLASSLTRLFVVSSNSNGIRFMRSEMQAEYEHQSFQKAKSFWSIFVTPLNRLSRLYLASIWR